MRFKFWAACIFLILLPVMAGLPADAATTSSGTLKIDSVTPEEGETNTTVSAISITGKGFSGSAGFRLRGSSSRDIVGDVDTANSTLITGTVNLNNQAPGDYQVCVYNNASSYVCGPAFTITYPRDAGTSSSIYFESNPSGATVLLNGTRIGTTVFTHRNATPGTFTVVLQKSGYEDYTETVTVTDGKRTRVSAVLVPAVAKATAVPQTTITTAKTFARSSLVVPTAWADTTETTAAPSGAATVIGAAALAMALAVLRRS